MLVTGVSLHQLYKDNKHLAFTWFNCVQTMTQINNTRHCTTNTWKRTEKRRGQKNPNWRRRHAYDGIDSKNVYNERTCDWIENITLRMFSGGLINTFFWSSDATEECKGRIHSEACPLNWKETDSLSSKVCISATPFSRTQFTSQPSFLMQT